ncbi:hypothetical protein KUCAC02_029144 [Chaenocephalus aceratus]|uniref:Uncharacterized protein n=1 Tax=Chaenocephalus aceratus TaxID=36190 RepID=A0ACB9X450_CHAAC|nr:hypothetical protein KUCAC02_029144 [Chaenocephalus aceratus]
MGNILLYHTGNAARAVQGGYLNLTHVYDDGTSGRHEKTARGSHEPATPDIKPSTPDIKPSTPDIKPSTETIKFS